MWSSYQYTLFKFRRFILGAFTPESIGDVLKQGGISPFGSVHLDILYMNATFTVTRNKTTQPRSCRRRSDLGFILLSPGATQPTPQRLENSFGMCCLATGAKRLVIKMDNMVSYFHVLLSLRGIICCIKLTHDSCPTLQIGTSTHEPAT